MKDGYLTYNYSEKRIMSFVGSARIHAINIYTQEYITDDSEFTDDVK